MIEGSCQCGSVRYRVKSESLKTYVCHCSECRKQSASAFGISVIVKSVDLQLVSGRPRVWSRAATKGGTLDCAFCPDCGTRLWHGNPDTDHTISLKGGAVDSGIDLTGVPHIWTASKLKGIEIPANSPRHEQEPED